VARRKAATAATAAPAIDSALTRSGWVEVTGGSGGDPWSDGMVVEGELVGVMDSTFTNDDGTMARLVTINTAEGAKTLRCPTILENRLMRLHVDDPVRITCLGKIKTSGGRRAWQFQVLAQPTAGLKPPVIVKGPGRPKGARNKSKAAK